jgi:chloramphenicol-sensitive protein RarD
LALYAGAVKHLPLSTVGFLQYIGPTIQFFAGILVLGESLDVTRLTGFGIVWIGVVLFLISMWQTTIFESRLKSDGSPVR